MDKKILIMGYGNMAQKYTKIIKKINFNTSIKYYSTQKIPNNLYKFDKKIINFNPEIIFICSSTNKHYTYLKKINQLVKNKIILVEKPIFEKIQNIKLNNKVYVGYNLRYDPIIREIKRLIKNKKIWSVEVFCNSYLPRWRKRNYKKTYSASKTLGGGVLLDLSHEIDYLLWYFKKINVKYVVNNKLSNLKINSDDNLVVYGSSKNVKQIILHLNYFSKLSSRTINISGQNINLKADLIKKKLVIEKNGKDIFKSWREKKFDKTFERQINSIIKNKNIYSASYSEGLNVLKTINKIRKR